MKKIILLSVYASFALSATFTNPLPASSKATENGGILSAIDAYKDGVGATVVTQTRVIDNSAMNTLVFKYGATAKSNGLIIGDQILLTGTASDKLLAGNLYPDGQSCTLSGKTGSTYLNGVCQGGTSVIVEGESCDDGISTTLKDTWVSGLCKGVVGGTLAGNGLAYGACEATTKNWITAGATCAAKGMRLPTLAETAYVGTVNGITGAGVNGVPSCASLSWTSTPNFYYYYVWSASLSVDMDIYGAYGVRCVK